MMGTKITGIIPIPVFFRCLFLCHGYLLFVMGSYRVQNWCSRFGCCLFLRQGNLKFVMENY